MWTLLFKIFHIKYELIFFFKLKYKVPNVLTRNIKKKQLHKQSRNFQPCHLSKFYCFRSKVGNSNKSYYLCLCEAVYKTLNLIMKWKNFFEICLDFSRSLIELFNIILLLNGECAILCLFISKHLHFKNSSEISLQWFYCISKKKNRSIKRNPLRKSFIFRWVTIL